jgi:hypothetical protein
MKKSNVWGMWQVWDRVEVNTDFWWGNLRAGDHFENRELVGGKI